MNRNLKIRALLLHSEILSLMAMVFIFCAMQSQGALACNCICIADNPGSTLGLGPYNMSVPAEMGKKYYVGYALTSNLCVLGCRMQYSMGYGGECKEGNYDGPYPKAVTLLP